MVEFEKSLLDAENLVVETLKPGVIIVQDFNIETAYAVINRDIIKNKEINDKYRYLKSKSFVVYRASGITTLETNDKEYRANGKRVVAILSESDHIKIEKYIRVPKDAILMIENDYKMLEVTLDNDEITIKNKKFLMCDASIDITEIGKDLKLSGTGTIYIRR